MSNSFESCTYGNKMKRIEQLQPLSKEHHQSLVLAQKAIKASMSGNMDIISKICSQIVDEYPDVWMIHFKIEEESIFKPIQERAKEINIGSSQSKKDLLQLCHKLQQEHFSMNQYYEQMKSGNHTILGEFGELLKQHTRTEERQLFPVLNKIFSQDELDIIYQTSLRYR